MKLDLKKKSEIVSLVQESLTKTLAIIDGVEALRIERFDLDQRIEVYLYYRDLYPECPLGLLYDVVIADKGKELRPRAVELGKTIQEALRR